MNNKMAIQILRGDVLGTDEQTHEAVFMAIKALKEQARVDAVEVVRCKDCLYRDGNACDYSTVYVRPNGYCQWGRREEDDKH